MNLGMFTIIIQVDPIFTSSNEDSHLPQNKKKTPKKDIPFIKQPEIEWFSFLGQKVWTAKG
jgi:hypothetical protein